MVGHLPVVLDVVILLAEIIGRRVEKRRRRVGCS
jgi:hypothetical protein